jgi:hypothetical protein
MLTLCDRVVDHDYLIGICCFAAKHEALKNKSKN